MAVADAVQRMVDIQRPPGVRTTSMEIGKPGDAVPPGEVESPPVEPSQTSARCVL